jgi:hypothetical protein
MPWNSVFPVGNVSVAENRTTGQQNTTYIETTMGKSVVGTNTNSTRDHFWNVSSNLDGRHRFIQSPVFTDGSNPVEPVGGSGMAAVLYLGRAKQCPQWYHKVLNNEQPNYQLSPGYLEGTVLLTSSTNYNTVTSVPDNVYGEIFMWSENQGSHGAQSGFFRSDDTTVMAWSNVVGIDGEGSSLIVKFGNGRAASGLNIKARADNTTVNRTWTYRIIYRKI